jgi:hypothetical protein
VRAANWPEQRSPKVIKTHPAEPGGTREEILHLTWGDLLRESGGEKELKTGARSELEFQMRQLRA